MAASCRDQPGRRRATPPPRRDRPARAGSTRRRLPAAVGDVAPPAHRLLVLSSSSQSEAAVGSSGSPRRTFWGPPTRPDGRPVPIQNGRDALDALRQRSLGHRPDNLRYCSSFIGGVLLTLPGGRVTAAHRSSPSPSSAARRAPASRRACWLARQFRACSYPPTPRRQRGEQAQLRRLLFGAREQATCALCGETYRMRFRYAAPVKRRSVCTELDLQCPRARSDATPCSFVGTQRKDMDGAVAEHVESLPRRPRMPGVHAGQPHLLRMAPHRPLSLPRTFRSPV